MRIVWIRGYYKKNYSVLRISGFASYCPCCFGVTHYEPLTHFLFCGCAVFEGDHFVLSAQYAADIGPLEMFFACRDLNAWRCPAVWLVFTPCWPKRMVFTCPPDLATTIWDLVGWAGVRFGLLKPLTPARANLGSRFGAGIIHQSTIQDPCVCGVTYLYFSF